MVLLFSEKTDQIKRIYSKNLTKSHYETHENSNTPNKEVLNEQGKSEGFDSCDQPSNFA